MESEWPKRCTGTCREAQGRKSGAMCLFPSITLISEELDREV